MLMLRLARLSARQVPYRGTGKSSCPDGHMVARTLGSIAGARPTQFCHKPQATIYGQQPRFHRDQVLCFCSSSGDTSSVLGTLGGRDIVSVGSINEADFFVKTITKDDIVANFSRSQGAGGQNVNKVSTKADIRFDVKHSPWMSPKLKAAVMEREAGRMNKQGELLISSQVTRSQANNLTDAIARLQQLLEEAAESIKPIESDPKKVKALAKRKAKASQKRLDKKKMHSDKKKTRGKVGKGDW